MTAPALLPSYRRIVFTDVDGTLIDHEGRLPDAWPAIRRSMLDAIVVLTSSRTVEELLVVQHVTGIEGPFIAENGAMLVLTNEWLEHAGGSLVSAAGRKLRLIPIGTREPELASIVKGAAAASGVVIETQHGSTSADISSGRHDTVTAHALSRSCSLLLRISGRTECRLRFFASLAAAGLSISHGGRWHIVQGGSSKGLAVRSLLQIVRRRVGDDLCVIGVGDGENDRSMLEATDLRFAMRQPGGDAHPALSRIDDVFIPARPGLDGWHEILPRMHPATAGGASHG